MRPDGSSGADLLCPPRGLSTAALHLLQLVRETTDPTGRSGDATSGERKVSLPCWSQVFQLSSCAFPPGQPTGAHHAFLTSRGLDSVFLEKEKPKPSMPPSPVQYQAVAASRKSGSCSFLKVWPQAVEEASCPAGALAAPMWCEGTPGRISSSWGGSMNGSLRPVFTGPP